MTKLKDISSKENLVGITPQHKIIQSMNSATEQPQAFYEIAQKAIAEIKQKLFSNAI